MFGFVFAAGLGTRLRPLTNERPKALVSVAGETMLDRVVRRLAAAGCARVVVNVHHFAEQVKDHVAGRDYGVPVVLSEEQPAPFETGGGLWHARALLRGGGVLLVHNVDVWTDLPLTELVRAHHRHDGIGTLAVADRATQRKLLFDDEGLVGRVDRSRGRSVTVRTPVGPTTERAFNGLHVLDEVILDTITERGAFSILEPYLRLAAVGHRFAPFAMDAWRWSDIGSHERLQALEASLS